MAKQYAPEALQRLYEDLAGSRFWVPEVSARRPYSGPLFAVYLRYSELFLEKRDAGERLWLLISEMPVVDAIGVFATINNILSLTGRDEATHAQLNAQLLEPDLLERVSRNIPQSPALGVVFNRLGNLVAMRDLILYGTNLSDSTELPLTRVGELALCANEFAERDPASDDAPTNLKLAAQAIRTWDVYNSRDLAYALTRMYLILTEILPGNDAVVVRLRERLGLDRLRVDGLTLPEFIAMAFAIFSYGNAVERESVSRVVLDPEVFFREFPNASELLNRFLSARALSVELLQEAFGGSAPITRERFDAELDEKTALDESLRVFRLRPFMRLNDGRVIILDLQFATDLCTTGMYWLIFDALPGSPSPERNVFRDLWGYCFEAYVVRLLENFYPPLSQILRADVDHPTGQIDALLDFGDDVFVVEIKSSLLVLPVKRRGDPEALAEEITRKFIVDEDGDPKAIQQLARAARAIIEGSVRTAIRPRRIFPVVITDEPATECLGFNAYLNERFQLEMAGLEGVTPLTVMSVNECEELLAYSADGAFSWADILLRRFDITKVVIWSVRQTIYDLRQEKGTDVRRNQFLLKEFERIYQIILNTYGANEQPVAKDPQERTPGR